MQSEGLYGIQGADDSSPGMNEDMMDVNAISAVGEQSRVSKWDEVQEFMTRRREIEAAEERLYALSRHQHQGRQDRRPGASSQKNDGSWVSGLSRQQVNDRIAAGQCIRCGSYEHFKADCPQQYQVSQK